MANKKTASAPKRTTPDQRPAPKAKGGALADKDLDKVAGGARMAGSEQCKETDDSGAMGCPS